MRRGKKPSYNADGHIKFWCRSGTWELQKSRRRRREREREREKDKIMLRGAVGA